MTRCEDCGKPLKGETYEGKYYPYKSSEEQTSLYSEEDRKTGIRLMNTRIIETFNENINQPTLEVFNSYMEFDRLGAFHAYWTKNDARVIIVFLKWWLDKHG